MRWRFISKPVGLDLERCCAAGVGNNRVLLSFFIFTLNLKYRIMENTFEIIVEKLNELLKIVIFFVGISVLFILP